MKTFSLRQTAVLLFGLFLHVVAASAATININIQSFAFTPRNPTINVGDTVIWTQNDQTTHTVSSTATPFVLNSGNLTFGKTYNNTFSTAGTFRYRCNIHPSMTGSVIVQAPPNAPPTVSFVAPTNGQAFPAPGNLAVQINAQDDVSVARVDYYRNNVFQQSLAAPPFNFGDNNLPAGNYTLLAVAVVNLGLATTSAPVSIFVVTNCTLVAPQWRAGTASLIVSNAIAGQPYILDSYVQDPGAFPGVWGPLQTNLAPAGVFEFADILAPSESRRLYRVRQFFP